ncbi:MAG TPA: hypothetical protein VH593_09855 [Ktedonobacteraceae bacterium]|jgi:hypothetical protein
MYDRVWITRDGRAIKVSDMETRHIKNCIAMIQRKWPWRAEYLDRLELELFARSYQNSR